MLLMASNHSVGAFYIKLRTLFVIQFIICVYYFSARKDLYQNLSLDSIRYYMDRERERGQQRCVISVVTF